MRVESIQHRILTLEKKILLPCFSRGSNPRPPDHESGALTTELYPRPGRVKLMTSIHFEHFDLHERA